MKGDDEIDNIEKFQYNTCFDEHNPSALEVNIITFYTVLIHFSYLLRYSCDQIYSI